MSHNKKGFTLIELLVVTPIIIIIIGSVIAVTVQASVSALRAHARSQLQYDVVSALDIIEKDVKLSSAIATSPNSVSLEGLATSSNPQSSDRKLVRRSNCEEVSSGLPLSEATTYSLTYETGTRSLLRKTDFTNKWCGGSPLAQAYRVWQKHDNTETIIADTDVSMSVEYDAIASSPGSASGLTVTMTGTRRVSGQDISYTGKMYVRSINI